MAVMQGVFETFVLMSCVVLGGFAVYDCFFIIASVVERRMKPSRIRGHEGKDTDGQTLKYGVLIPAHNEELLLAGLLKSIHATDYPSDRLDIYVVADNCTDRTADIAREMGAICKEREDAVLRGKPYALSWIIERINLNDYDAFVVLDADTEVDKGFFQRMSEHINEGSEVAQGYFGVLNPDENWLTRLSILPGIMKFHLHHPGKRLCHLSVPLAGNGMCFVSDLFKLYGWNAYSVAENWEYYVQLTLAGHVVAPAEDAVIYSQVAHSLKAGRNQRARWFQGRLETLLRYGRKLLFGPSKAPWWIRADALLELAHPSHAMFLFFTAVVFAVALTGSLAGWTGKAYVWMLAAVGLFQIVFFVVGLIYQKAPLRTWLALTMVPLYLFWKVAVTVSGILGLRNRQWIKTERH